MSVVRRPRAWLFALLGSYALYAALYIYRTSFVLDGTRYFALFDDAMVSMRYARNIALGYGAVWNPGGARIEGFTNPLWTLYMAALHLLPVPAAQVSLLVQVTGVALVLTTLVITYRLAEDLASGTTGLAGLVAVALTAFYAPLNNWTLQGMEVGLLTLLTTAGVWWALRALARDRLSPWPYLVFGVGMLTRLDAAVPFVAVWLFLLVVDRPRRLAHAALGLGTLAVFAGLQEIVRFAYYGDWLPNTYYLKLTGLPWGPRLGRGFYTQLWFIWHSNLVLFLMPLSVLLFRRDLQVPAGGRAVLLPLWIFGAQMAYSVYIGGDTFESAGGANRYVCIAMPLFFAMLGVALEHFLHHGDPDFRAPGRLATALGRPFYDLRILFILVVLLTALNFLSALPGVGLFAALLGLLIVAVLLVARTVMRRRAASGSPLDPRAFMPDARSAPRFAAVFVLVALLNFNATLGPASLGEWLLIDEHPALGTNRDMVRLAGVLRDITDDDAQVAVVLAGVLPYFADRPAIDLLGKSDAVVAHEPMHLLPINTPGYPFGFWPGHSKWDYAYSFGQLQPDVVAQTWWWADTLAGDDPQRYLQADYQPYRIDDFLFYVRNGSPHVRWDRLPPPLRWDQLPIP
jgi:hypothetical protein